MRASWLFPDGVSRERMLEMDRRIRPVRRAAFGVLALALVASGPWLGWWTIVPLALAAGLFHTADVLIDRMERPELALFGAWAGSQVIIAVSVALTGGPTMPTMSWFAIPLVTLSARFSERGIALGVGVTLALFVAVAFAVDPAAVIADPPLVIIPAGLLVAIAMLQTVLMRSDVDTRAQAVIDPLTGVLNRKALEYRVAEFQVRAETSGEPIGLIVGDIDHFKRVNDTYGHSAGDAALRDVGHVMRKALRAYDLVYRLGGEEFLVLLPGADLDTTGEIAEQLRRALSGTPMGGHRLTMSFGISASGIGERFDYDALFAEADDALYMAKRAGRDRVCCTAGAVVTAA